MASMLSSVDVQNVFKRSKNGEAIEVDVEEDGDWGQVQRDRF